MSLPAWIAALPRYEAGWDGELDPEAFQGDTFVKLSDLLAALPQASGWQPTQRDLIEAIGRLSFRDTADLLSHVFSRMHRFVELASPPGERQP